MKIKSLGLKTDIFISSLECEMHEHENYVYMKTPSRPNYYWGNFLITQAQIDSQTYFDTLLNVYKRHFDDHDKFITIAFDNPDGDIGKFSVFKNNDFSVEISKVMKLEKEEFNLSEDLNNDFEFTPIATKDYINELVELHIDPDWAYGEGQEEFLRSKFEYLIKFEAQGFGQRYVLKDGDKLIADLGIYHKDKLARFNDVVTHADYRNRGLCFTLVSKATDYILKNTDVETLVMHADENYFAHKIYAKVGFVEAEKLVAIEWVQGKETGPILFNSSSTFSTSIELLKNENKDVQRNNEVEHCKEDILLNIRESFLDVRFLILNFSVLSFILIIPYFSKYFKTFKARIEFNMSSLIFFSSSIVFVFILEKILVEKFKAQKIDNFFFKFYLSSVMIPIAVVLIVISSFLLFKKFILSFLVFLFCLLVQTNFLYNSLKNTYQSVKNLDNIYFYLVIYIFLQFFTFLSIVGMPILLNFL